MRLLLTAASLLLPLTACDQGKTDLGDLPTDSDSGTSSGSGGETEGSASDSEGETGSTTDPGECAGPGENCEDGCCPGFGCNFANLCEACTPAGEVRGVDGAGCCDGLAETPVGLCYEPTCDGECPEGIVECQTLHQSTTSENPDGFIADCAPEACLASRELLLQNPDGEPGLQCTGPGGSSDCAATGGALQQFVYESEALTLTLGFDAGILAGYSTQSFNEHFVSLAGQLTIPDATVPLTTFAETGTHSEFVYADGRLQFTISVPLDSTFARIESDAEDCISDDIAGTCACYYADLGTYDVVVDLEIENP